MMDSRNASDIEAMAQDPVNALDRTAERIRLVHEATMRAAARIRVDADRMRAVGDQGQPADERTLQMAELAETIGERVEAISRDCESLARMVDGALAAARRIEGYEPAPPEPSVEPLDPANARPEPAPERPPRFWRRGWFGSRSRSQTQEGLKLVATRMAIAGSSRPEIEQRLRSEFGPAEADRALEEIFADGSSNGGRR